MATTIEQDQKKQAEIRNAARSGETREMALPTAAPKRRRVALGIGAVVAILALIWGAQKYLYGRSHQSTDDAAVDGHIIPVVAKVGGYVAKVTVGENDHV